MATEMLLDREADRARFSLLFTNSRPRMPEGYTAPLATAPLRQQIRERRERAAQA